MSVPGETMLGDPIVDLRDYRDALGYFVTGVSVVTTRPAVAPGKADGAVGVTVNTFTSVSLDPPLVSFALDRAGSSAQSFLDADHFCINVLARDQMELSQKFASSGPKSCESEAYELGPVGSPVFPGILAAFHCHLETTLDGGDHVILLGRVAHYTYDEDKAPLVFHRGRYGGVRD